MRFPDRAAAGRRLGEALARFAGGDVVVLALPRGGVPVAFEVARALSAPLDVIIVRKLGVPFQPELGMGAVGEDGTRVVDKRIVTMAAVEPDDLAAVADREHAEARRRAQLYRGGRAPVPLTGRTAIVVDDGVATGSTARAACRIARTRGATRVVLAVPVGPSDVQQRMVPDADEVVCLSSDAHFRAVGQLYRDFRQVGDGEVVDLLKIASAREFAGVVPHGPQAGDRPDGEEVWVEAGGALLAGRLTLPGSARAVVVSPTEAAVRTTARATAMSRTH